MREATPGAAIVRGLEAADALPVGWEETFAVVDRALFVPDRVWPFDLAAGAYAPVTDRSRAPRPPCSTASTSPRACAAFRPRGSPRPDPAESS